jgi:hypothetical protein
MRENMPDEKASAGLLGGGGANEDTKSTALLIWEGK